MTFSLLLLKLFINYSELHGNQANYRNEFIVVGRQYS